MSTPQPLSPDALASELFAGRRDFPVEALPTQLRAFAQSTAQRCNVSCCVAATGCLSVAARMIGCRARLDTGLGGAVGVNNFFLVGADPTANSRWALGSVLAPMLRLQERLLGDEDGQGAAEFGRGHGDVSSQLLRGRANSKRRSPYSVLLSSDFREGNWERLIQAGQGSLLHYNLDGELVRELSEGRSKHQDSLTKFLKRTYFEELTLAGVTAKGNTEPPQRQSLNLLWMGFPEQVKHFAVNARLLASGLAPCFIAFDAQAPASELNRSALDTTVDARAWEQKLEELLYLADSTPEQTWQVSPDVQEVLCSFMNYVHKNMGRLHPNYRPILAAWQERIWRIAFLLHLLSDWHMPTISVQTAWPAVYLSAWYMGRQFELLP